MQLEQEALEKLLRNGPMTKPQFMRLLHKLAAHLNLKCNVSNITFYNIDLSGNHVTHRADVIVNEIRKYDELVDISTIIKEHGNGMSFTLFQTHLQMHQRLCHTIFIVANGPRWMGRKLTPLNVFDRQSLLRHVRTAGCTGVSLLALASEYQGCGCDIMNFIEIGAMVIVGERVYCITVAQPKIEGALTAWNQNCLQ